MSQYYTQRADGTYDVWDGDSGAYVGTSATGPFITGTGTSTYNPVVDWGAYYASQAQFVVDYPGAAGSVFGVSQAGGTPSRVVVDQAVTIAWSIPDSYSPIVFDPGGGAPSGGQLQGRWRQNDWAVTIIRNSDSSVVASASGVGTTATVTFNGLPEGTFHAYVFCHATNTYLPGSGQGWGNTSAFTIAAPVIVIPPPPAPPSFFASMGTMGR